MATITIFAKSDYVAQDGTVPLYLRLTVNRKVFPPIKLKKRTKPSDWDEKISRVKSTHPNERKLNQFLDQVQRKADDVLLDHELSARVITYQSFCHEFAGLSPYDFFYVAESFIASVRPKKSALYVKKIESVVRMLKVYAPGINMAQIDFDFIDKYMNHLRTDRSSANEDGQMIYRRANGENSINSNMKILRRICKHAMKLKILKENPFSEITLHHVKTERDSLTLEEYKRYEQLLDAPLPFYLRRTLVWFLLACCTGRRWKDLEEFGTWEFSQEYVKILQNKRVFGRQDRKVTLLYLNEPIRRLLDIIRSEKLNVITTSCRKFLKQINTEVGIHKDISFHSGRHTFANINKELTQDITIRRDLLGHDSVKSTLIYDHGNPKLLQEVMKKWNTL